MKNYVIFFLFLVKGFILITGCSSVSQTHLQNYDSSCDCFDYSLLTEEERLLADSILADALDHEALYTLLEPLKPMSSMAMFSFQTAKRDSSLFGNSLIVSDTAAVHDSLAILHRIVRALSCGLIKAVAVPYRVTEKGRRNIQISIVDISALNIMLDNYKTFWAQYGLGVNAAPEVVVAVIENEQIYDRWRGYGYLFGYPEYAVDFFVNAGISEDTSKQFVERAFFNIPVYSGNRGHFVYAMPKDYTATEIDSTLYREAASLLEKYKKVRPRYIDSYTGKLHASELIRDWYREHKSKTEMK